MLAWLCRLEHFWHIHEPVEREHGFTEGIDFLYKAFFRTTNHVFFAARKQQQQWQMRFSALADKSGVLYNPVCEFEHTVCSRRECWFGYLGSRAERKNILSLIRAFAKLYTTHPDIRLLLSINDGEDDEKINQMIIDLNLESVIHQRVVMNVSDFYNDIDVFVLPSYSETWGMVVLEAMQHGIATIVTTHTGLSELLQHEKHTLFIDPYSMNSICDAMARMTDNQFRTQIGAEGQALILQYRFNELFQTTIRKYLHG
jgi:glycosyltransferase involved in cell wall biosynthesis